MPCGMLRMTRGHDGSLLLSCKALASSIRRRFIPALPHLRFAKRFPEGGHSCPPLVGLEAGRRGVGGGGRRAGKPALCHCERSEAISDREGNGDCFASLAMTQRGHRAPALPRKTEMRLSWGGAGESHSLPKGLESCSQFLLQEVYWPQSPEGGATNRTLRFSRVSFVSPH